MNETDAAAKAAPEGEALLWVERQPVPLTEAHSVVFQRRGTRLEPVLLENGQPVAGAILLTVRIGKV